jgi:hypothetical protein
LICLDELGPVAAKSSPGPSWSDDAHRPHFHPSYARHGFRRVFGALQHRSGVVLLHTASTRATAAWLGDRADTLAGIPSRPRSYPPSACAAHAFASEATIRVMGALTTCAPVPRSLCSNSTDFPGSQPPCEVSDSLRLPRTVRGVALPADRSALHDTAARHGVPPSSRRPPSHHIRPQTGEYVLGRNDAPHVTAQNWLHLLDQAVFILGIHP